MSDSRGRVATLKQYLDSDTANVQLVCDLLDEMFATGDYAGADKVIEGLAPAARESAGVRFRAARGALVQGRYADAELQLQSLIESGRDEAAIWHDLSFCQLCQRRTDLATLTLGVARARYPEDAELHIVAARVSMMDGNFTQAHIDLDSALALAPDHATALGLRALALLDDARAEEGAAVARACLAKHPDQHEALLVAGTEALWRQALDESERHFRRALARHPNSGRALSGVGQISMLRSDLPKAQSELQQAVVAMPDHIGTWHALAWAQLLQGQAEDAQGSYERAYDLDHNFAESHGGLALLHALNRRTEEAELSVKRALRLDPACATALYARTLLLSDAGREVEADAILATLMSKTGRELGMDIRDFARSLRARVEQRAG